MSPTKGEKVLLIHHCVCCAAYQLADVVLVSDLIEERSLRSLHFESHDPFAYLFVSFL
jgi:hypothetical protein